MHLRPSPLQNQNVKTKKPETSKPSQRPSDTVLSDRKQYDSSPTLHTQRISVILISTRADFVKNALAVTETPTWLTPPREPYPLVVQQNNHSHDGNSIIPKVTNIVQVFGLFGFGQTPYWTWQVYSIWALALVYKSKTSLMWMEGAHQACSFLITTNCDFRSC